MHFEKTNYHLSIVCSRVETRHTIISFFRMRYLRIVNDTFCTLYPNKAVGPNREGTSTVSFKSSKNISSEMRNHIQKIEKQNCFDFSSDFSWINHVYGLVDKKNYVNLMSVKLKFTQRDEHLEHKMYRD